MINNGWSGKVFLIDGFPRNPENQQAWRAICADTEILYVFNFVAEDSIVISRALAREENRDDDTAEVI
jgi:adenylate kinase family enzyme